MSRNISFLKSDMVVHILTEFLMSCLKRKRPQSNVFDRRAWSSTHYNTDDKLVQRPISYKSNQYSLKSYESFPFKTILYIQGCTLGLKSTSVTLGLGSETFCYGVSKMYPDFWGWGRNKDFWPEYWPLTHGLLISTAWCGCGWILFNKLH